MRLRIKSPRADVSGGSVRALVQSGKDTGPVQCRCLALVAPMVQEFGEASEHRQQLISLGA
jgi:hypothetical protein